MEKSLKKEFVCDIKEIDEDNYSFWATASTENLDRDGDIIKSTAWDLKNFKRNSVIPLFHNYHSFPVAKADKVKVEDGALRFQPIFAVKENPEAKIAWDLYKNGYMRSFSVGFLPRTWEEKTRKDGRVGRDYTDVELLEISAVLVPSNPNALSDAKAKGINIDLLEKKDIDIADVTVFRAELDQLKKDFIELISKHEALKKEMVDEFVQCYLKIIGLQNKMK